MKYPPSAQSARITEIFSSLQGEGPHVGERHIFIRFEECNIHCEYCDELHKIGSAKSLDQVLMEVDLLEKKDGPHQYVSLTGGEPLLYSVFLKPLMEALRARGLKTYLETNGILWPALSEVIHLCDAISMDVKPGSVTGERGFEDAHRKFLEMAKSSKTHIKMIISKAIDGDEFLSLVRMIRETTPDVLLVLQPLSAEMEGHQDPELFSIMEDLQTQALHLLSNVRIIPRFHKILQIR